VGRGGLAASRKQKKTVTLAVGVVKWCTEPPTTGIKRQGEVQFLLIGTGIGWQWVKE